MSLRVDRDAFWKKYRSGLKSLQESLEEVEVTTVNGFLDKLESDDRVSSLRYASYMLVTARWEQDRYRAPRERGSEAYLRYLLGKLGNSSDPARKHHILYRGGGPCHTTGLDNYRFVDAKLGLDGDLVLHPEKIINPRIGYETMVRGHLEGWFSGGKHKLSSHFDGDSDDPRGARAIINGGELRIADAGLKLPPSKRTKRQLQCISALKAQISWYWVIQAAFRASTVQQVDETGIEGIIHLDGEPPEVEGPDVEVEVDDEEGVKGTVQATTIEGPTGENSVQVVSQTAPQAAEPVVKGPIDNVYSIASSGLTTIANRVSTGSISGGMMASIGAFVKKNYVMLGFGVLLLLMGFILFMFIYKRKHDEKLKEADIRSDPTKYNVSFEKR